jgi:hypothetical protein
MLPQMTGFHSFFMVEEIALGIIHSFFSQSSVDQHFGCLLILAIVNTATVNMVVKISL